MIHQIWSSDRRFKALSFFPTFNVLLADRTLASTDLQTRNRAGKSSLVEIIHFLTGADGDSDSLFAEPAIIDNAFSMTFDLAGRQVAASRSGADQNTIFISSNNFEGWPIVPRSTKSTPQLHLGKKAWNDLLLTLMFRLDGTNRSSYSPSVRSLLGYFARRESSHGFLTPFSQARKQQPWDEQVAVTFLLGLDWSIPQALQVARGENSQATKATKAVKKKSRGGKRLATSAELRTRLAVLHERLERLQANVSNFRVLEEYSERENEASSITQELGSLADQNILDHRFREELQAALDEAALPELPNLEKLYAEVNLTLPGSVLRRFEEVSQFHESVIRNRRSYLQQEIQQLSDSIESRRLEQARLDERLAEIMKLLQSHGALDQFTQLQRELGRLEGDVASTRALYEEAIQLERAQTEYDRERSQLFIRLQQDYAEQEDTLQHAIGIFERISASLYEEAGSLTVNPTENGPDFDVRIQGSGSRGITNMQIFCFDLMIMQLCSERGIGPGFLVHDSHWFDGVDERQVANAFEIGSRAAEIHGFQYIVTMNSDVMSTPSLFSSGFTIESSVLPVRITDDVEEGGLFGHRF